MRRRPRTDANQKAIVEALEASGWTVANTSMVGAGFPDLVAWKAATGQYRLIEVKAAKGKLTGPQEHFVARWPVVVLRSVEDALHLAGVPPEAP